MTESAPTYQTLLWDLDRGVLQITLNRPDRLNAYDETMHAELPAALRRADALDEVRAIVVTGAGRGFCAGADLSKGGATFAREVPAEVHRDGGGQLALQIFRLTKPIIAAINGPAVGVGITMTLPMDVRIAAEEARMGFVFTRRGMVPEACSSFFLPRVVGISRAAEWVLTGRVFPAAEALAGGLVSRVVPGPQLLSTAHALAREIVENTAPVSVALARQMLWRQLAGSDPYAAHLLESKGIYWRGKSADAREGVTSFLEKRTPHFPELPSRDLPPFYPWWDEPDVS